MPKQIVWSTLAEDDFANILEYLHRSWGEKVAYQFIELTERMLLQISINSRQFPLIYRKKKIRKCVLTRHNTLIYRENKREIDILRIYDTRQDPESLTY